jgi:hypothetical protein
MGVLGRCTGRSTGVISPVCGPVFGHKWLGVQAGVLAY